MATEKKDFYFKGKVAWLTNKKSEKYGNFHFLFFPVSAAERKAVKDTGIRNGVKEDDGAKSGVEGWFYTFRSDEPFNVLNPDGSPVTVAIGNGTEVAVKLTVEKFPTASYGTVVRGTVDSIVVENLVPYEPKKEEDQKSKDLPA